MWRKVVEDASSPALGRDGTRLAYIQYKPGLQDVGLTALRTDGREAPLL